MKKNKCSKKSDLEGAPGFEPGTSRSAVECSTTELYPQSSVASPYVPFEIRNRLFIIDAHIY